MFYISLSTVCFFISVGRIISYDPAKATPRCCQSVDNCVQVATISTSPVTAGDGETVYPVCPNPKVHEWFMKPQFDPGMPPHTWNPPDIKADDRRAP